MNDLKQSYTIDSTESSVFSCENNNDKHKSLPDAKSPAVSAKSAAKSSKKGKHTPHFMTGHASHPGIPNAQFWAQVEAAGKATKANANADLIVTSKPATAPESRQHRGKPMDWNRIVGAALSMEREYAWIEEEFSLYCVARTEAELNALYALEDEDQAWARGAHQFLKRFYPFLPAFGTRTAEEVREAIIKPPGEPLSYGDAFRLIKSTDMKNGQYHFKINPIKPFNPRINTPKQGAAPAAFKFTFQPVGVSHV